MAPVLDPLPPEMAIKTPVTVLHFERRDLDGVPGTIGKARRSPITGDISLLELENFPDFQVVDLARRPVELGGTMESLQADKYLFKAYPLTHRTWLYQQATLATKSSSARVGKHHDEFGLMKYVFSTPCVDAPIHAGRGSPLPCFVPMAIGTSLTGNLLFVVITILLVTVVILVSKVANTPTSYEKARLWSLPLRLGFTAFTIAIIDLTTFLSSAGYVLTLTLLAADFVQGDISALRWSSFHCTYEVLKTLPGRLVVCYRNGAADWETLFGKRGKIDECVSSIGTWAEQYHLIVDLADILVELRQLTPDDWKDLALQHFNEGKPIPYLALDTFGLPDDPFFSKPILMSPDARSGRRAQDLRLEEM